MAFDANKMRELMEEKQASKQQEEVTQQAEAGTTWTQDRMAELNTEIEDSEPEETYTFDPEESRQNFNAIGTLVSNTFNDIARAETDYVMAEQRGDEEEIERARVNALRAPFKEGVRQFTAAYADDNQSRFQSFAQKLRQSSANIEYFMTDEEKLATARKVGDALNIPPAALLASTENMQNAMNAYDYVKKLEAAGGSMEQAYTNFPKLKEIAQMDPQGAALALKDLHNIHEVRDIASGWSAFWKSGNDSYEYGVLKAKDAMEGLTDEERTRADELKKEMENAPVAPSFFVNPALAMLSGVQSLPEMIYSSANALPYAVTGGVIGAAAVGAPTIGVGLPAGALAGFKKGFDVGLFIEMARPMMGRKYAEYQAMTDENGNRLFTDAQAREWAIAETIPEAFVEVASFKYGAGKTVLGEHAKKAVVDAMRGVTKPTAGKAFLDLLFGAGKGIAETGVSETIEEGTQGAISDVFDAAIKNAAEKGNGDFTFSGLADTMGEVSWSDIGKRAVAQGLEAAPGAFFLGGISAVGGAPMGGVRYGLESRAWNRQFGEMTKTERTTMTGTIMLEQLQTAVHDSNLQETAPDVQQEIIRDELKETPWQMAYVDVETALKNENGIEDVREAGKAAGMTDEEIQQAIEEKGTIAVPLESYAQSAASPELLDSVSFSPDADSLARIRENAKKVEAEYTKRTTAEIEKQIKLTEAMTQELFPEKQEQDAAMTAIYQDPENPYRGWKELYDKAVTDRDEILAPALAALERGMGQGTSVVETVNDIGEVSTGRVSNTVNDIGEVSTGRVSNNEEWYSKFYAEHKRKPNKEELREMARKMMLAEPDAPQVQGWTVSDKETAEMMANEKDRLAAADQEVKVLEGIKERMQELNGAEMQLTAGMTPEAYKVYRAITTDLLKFNGKVGRAARVSALLNARHADVYAKRMQRLGHENYTAMNWLKDKIEGIRQGRNAQAGGYNQTAGNLADQKLEKDIENWKKEVNDIASFPDQTEEEKRRMPIVCGSLPLVYSLVNKKVGINDVNINKPVVISKKHFYEILHVKETSTTHGHKDEVEQDIVNSLPELLANPAAIMRNFDQDGNIIPGEVIAILEKTDKKGNVIIAPVSLKEESGAYRLKTFFGRQTNETFERRLFNTDNFLYAANKKRFSAAIAQLSKKNALGIKPSYGDTFYSNIPSEKDLVNLRNQNVGYYQFAGKNAETADAVKLAEAQSMEESGASAEDIYKATGWLKGEDGKWRFEIQDDLDKINLDLLQVREHLPLEELYDNEDLFAAYPFLRGVMVSEEDMQEGSIGRLDVENNIIFLNADLLAAGEEKLKKSIVHEVQHLIQMHEKFAMGGNPADVRGQILSEIRRIKGDVNQNKDAQEKYSAYQEKTLQALNNPTPETWEEMQLAAEAFEKTVEPENKKRFERLMSRMDALQKAYDSQDENFFLYARLGGEQEARKTADRAEEWTKKNREVEKASRALNEGMENATQEQRDALIERMKLAFEIDGQPTDQQIALMEKYESEMGEELSALYDDYMWERGELEEFAKDMPRPHNRAIIVFDGQEIPYSEAEQTPRILDVFNQSAWHGSPHTFQKFDLGAIGTGEGAQAHGWGLYFAQDREVSERYKERLASRGGMRYRVTINGETVDQETKDVLDRISLNYLYREGKEHGQEAVKKEIEEAIDRRRGRSQYGIEQLARKLVKALDAEIKHIDKNPKLSITAFLKNIEGSEEESRFKTIVESARRAAKEEGRRATIQDVKKAINKHAEAFRHQVAEDEREADVLESLDLDNLNIEEDTGSLFEVEIPDEDVMLDEQKKLSEQPEKVKEALKKITTKISGRTEEQYEKYLAKHPETTGEDFYKQLTGFFWEQKAENPKRAASELLNEYGIKGISYDGYRDGRCYVVFDDQAINIIDTYNQEMNGQGIQGQTIPYSDGKRLVELFETADESTFLHESGHVFLMDLEDLAAMGDEESVADLKTVDEWTAWHEGAAAKYKGTPWAKEFAGYEKEIKEAQKAGDKKKLDSVLRRWKQERFARAFEIYLKEGRAPSKGLRGVFKKFCDFLKQVYVALVSDGARASAQVEAIMGRLIATDEEIEAAEQDERYKDFMQAGGEKLMYEDAAETFSRWHEEAREEARDKLRKIVMRSLTGKLGRKRKEILREERARKEEELSNLPVYLARQAAKETGIKDAWKAYFPQGEEAWKKADKAAPPIEKALDEHMRKFEADLDKKEVQDFLKEETIEAAMSTARSHEKLLRMEQRAFARKAALANNLSVKTRTRLENVERWIDEMPDFIDQSDLGTWNKAINSLKLSNRWTKEELDAIDRLSVSASKEAAKSNFEALKKIMKERKVGISDLREANKGRIAALRKQAKATIARQTLAQATQVQTHRREEKEAAKEAEKLAKKEMWAEAAAAKERELLASFMASEAEKVKNRQDAILKHIRTQLNAKTKLPKDERYWHQHLAYLLRITDKDAAKPEGLKSLADIAKSLGEGLDVATDDDGRSDILGLMEKLTDENAYKDGYHGMKLSEFEDAADVLQVLYTTGKDKFNLKLTQGKTIGEAVEEILADPTAYNGAKVARSTITGNPNRGGVLWSETLSRIPGVGDALSKYAQRYGLSLTKPEELVNLLGKRAHRYIYDTYDRAAEQEASMTADFCGKMEEIIAKRYKPEEMREWQARKYAWQGQPVSKENILAMAMNLGNDINMDRLIMGMEANPAELQKFIADHMTEKDWLFCQDVWDLLQTYWPETVRVEMELNGTRLKPQEARAFTVKTKDAKGHIKELDLRGGYYPIKYDPELSTKSKEQSGNAEAAASMSGAVVLGMGRGFTKDRAAKGAVKQRPLLLDLSVIPEHVGEAIHNITTRIAARDVFRIVNNGAMKEHITNTMGQDAYNVLQKWATDVWKIKPEEKNSAENLINGAIRRLRQNSGIAIMGYRMWPTIENATNIFPMMDALGASETFSAMKDYYTNQREFDELIAKSLFMKERTERMDRDMKGQRGMFERQNAVSEWLVKHAYDPITYTDLLTSKPLWARSYKNAFPEMLEEVRTENEENAKTFEKRRAEYDAINATLTDMKKRRADMQNELRRRNRREAPLMETDLTRMSRQTIQDEIYILDGEIEEKSKELFIAGEKMERASTLVIRTERETLEEAEHRAILAADKAVRDVIGSGDVKDLSEVQRSKNEAVKALTMFYSYFNTQANAIIAAHWKGKWKGGAKYDFTPIAKAIAYRFLLTAALSTAMRWIFFNEGNDDKDKYKKDKEGNKIEVPALERALKQYAKNALSTTVGGAYGLREVGNWAINRFIDGHTYGSGARFDGMYGSFVNQVLKEAELILNKSARDEKAKEEEEKRQERYRNATPTQRRRMRQDEQYRKPPNTISYADILRGAGSIGASLTAGTLGVTEPIANAVLGTMQYIFDSDGRYDATIENMMWSAFWTKKPVKRTPPEKPKKTRRKEDDAR